MMNKEFKKLYDRLNTPSRIQDFLNTVPANFEKNGETCMSPFYVLKNRTAHCLEGAMLAASILKHHGYKPLLLDLRARRPDDDHVVALFRIGDNWGAISKTNHAVLRYRDPIYKSLRELALSYFHEYFDNASGLKNLREYSLPLNLNRFSYLDWELTSNDLWEVVKALDEVKHFDLVPEKVEKLLRKADKIEVTAGKLTDWKRD